MEYPSGEGGRIRSMVTAEEVIAKLKDDGDFDALRLKLIRRLKDNEELRNSIILSVKQSETLNCPGAENLKPRHLSDAIFQEIGENVMSQISDWIWAVLRSSDGMKKEINETVESVYNKFINPKVQEAEQDMTQTYTSALGSQEANEPQPMCAANETISSDSEPSEPPGFSFRSEMKIECEHNESPMERLSDGQNIEESLGTTHVLKLKSTVSPPPSASPSATTIVDNKPKDIDSDDDPDIPPGFG